MKENMYEKLKKKKDTQFLKNHIHLLENDFCPVKM